MSIQPSTIDTIVIARALYGNIAKGPAILSNMLMTPRAARDAITSSALVQVVYDPRTPNGQQLIAILEASEWSDLALARLLILQLDIDQNSNWSDLANDAEIMQGLLLDPHFREIMFNSADIVAAILAAVPGRRELLANAAALAGALAQPVSRGLILDNDTFIDEAIIHDNGHLIFRDAPAFTHIMAHHSEHTATFITTAALFAHLLDNATALTMVFNTRFDVANELILQDAARFEVVCTNAASHGALLAHSAAMDVVANSTDRMIQLMGFNAAIQGRFFASAHAMGRLAASAGDMALAMIFGNATVRDRMFAGGGFSGVANSVQGRSFILDNITRRGQLFNNVTGLRTFMNSSAAASHMLTNTTMLNEIMATADRRGVLFGSSVGMQVQAAANRVFTDLPADGNMQHEFFNVGGLSRLTEAEFLRYVGNTNIRNGASANTTALQNTAARIRGSTTIRASANARTIITNASAAMIQNAFTSNGSATGGAASISVNRWTALNTWVAFGTASNTYIVGIGIRGLNANDPARDRRADISVRTTGSGNGTPIGGTLNIAGLNSGVIWRRAWHSGTVMERSFTNHSGLLNAASADTTISPKLKLGI